MKVDPIIVFSVLGGLILVLLFVGAPIRPLRWIGQLCIKIVVGALLLFFVNAFGTSFDLHIPINLITSSVSGILGIPGLAALIIIKTMIIG
jgi:inhibitor of the pro-sigma K processing machinery